MTRESLTPDSYLPAGDRGGAADRRAPLNLARDNQHPGEIPTLEATQGQILSQSPKDAASGR